MTATSTKKRREDLLSDDVEEKPASSKDNIETIVGRKRPRSVGLARLVSQEFGSPYTSENDETQSLHDTEQVAAPSRSESPMHCVSEIDCDSKASTTKTDVDEPTCEVPLFPNPLHNKNLLSTHVRSVRLEAELFPMRQQIARLMAHPTHNRRGLFNRPVNPVALGLLDYHKIITKPMDLGTVKAKLHAVAYANRDEVANDIRLVFQNAMTYNPRENLVHIAAKSLLGTFEEAYKVVQATRSTPALLQPNALAKRAAFLAQSKQERSSINTPPKAGPVTSLAPERTASAPAKLPAVAHTPTPSQTNVSSSPLQVDACQFASSSSNMAGKTPVVKAVTPSSESPLVNMSDSDYNIFAPFANPARSSLRGSIILDDPFLGPSNVEKAMKRAKNIAAKNAKHSCRSCLGRSCGICNQSCLSLEPAIMICAGFNCAGAKIRKGATYFITPDGHRQFCQKCYTSLQAILPPTSEQTRSKEPEIKYKRDLLKRKNDEEIAEKWLTCRKCKKGVHKMCVMHNEFAHSEEDYACPSCFESNGPVVADGRLSPSPLPDDLFSFVSGSEEPVRMVELLESESQASSFVCAESLPETAVSIFVQAKIRQCMVNSGVPENAEKTTHVRVISDCNKSFKVPDVVRKHFRQQSMSDKMDTKGVMPPSTVRYNSKSLALFQKIDGMDICLFCMYVHEYDCEDDFADGVKGQQTKRVYIAYLDSVEYFRPRQCRTQVFHEMIVAYLATARARGYESAHIWACPPSRGNSFVFWNHPASQRTPNKDHLIQWYHGALSKGVESGVITDVKSLFESSFPFDTKPTTDPTTLGEMIPRQEGVLDGRLVCPPLMDGDYWVEEAVRVHTSSIAKNLKAKPTKSFDIDAEKCPATQMALLLRNKIMAHQSSQPFRKPVNAVAMKLKDYHKIVPNPMDLGTVYSRCVLGEYDTLGDLVSDVDLVFANAMRYNPKGHFVHNLAVQMKDFFMEELNMLTSKWTSSLPSESHCWKQFSGTSLSLDKVGSIREPDTVFKQKRSVTPDASSSETELTLPVSSILGKREDTTTSKEIKAVTESTDKNSTLPISIPQVSERAAKPGRKTLNSKSPRALKGTSRIMQTMLNANYELLSDGTDAIIQRMVGDDVWLLDRRNPNPPKPSGGGRKKGNGKRKKSVANVTVEEPPTKRRRQTWLGEEVGSMVRRMRNCFFSCALTTKDIMSEAEQGKVTMFEEYIADFDSEELMETVIVDSKMADARASLLEFSQFRNLEFDTLRRAKYSTSVLLYHLLNKTAPGLIPSCSDCCSTIQDVRWHRLRRVEDRYHTGRVPPTLRASCVPKGAASKRLAEISHRGEELCAGCFERRDSKEDFIPLPVTFKDK